MRVFSTGYGKAYEASPNRPLHVPIFAKSILPLSADLLQDAMRLLSGHTRFRAETRQPMGG
jgi:hypothetical protein